MAVFFLKLDFSMILITALFAITCYWLSKKLWTKYIIHKVKKQLFTEQMLTYSLKAFTSFYLMSMFLLAFTLPVIAYSYWDVLTVLPSEMGYFTILSIGLVAIGGLVTFAVAIRHKRNVLDTYIPISPESEPELFELIRLLSAQYDVKKVNDVRITPGSEISLSESVVTFDDVLAGNTKVVEIGLSAMELLNASDLKVLLARQFAYYAESNEPPMAFIKRFKSRLTAMNNNLMEAGFLLMFNQTAAMIMPSTSLIDWLTGDYQTMAEFKADESVANFTGTNRLTHALARYGVETELYRDIIDMVDNRSRGQEAPLEGNIYDSMRRAQGETTDQLRIMVDHLFQDDALARGDIGKKTLKVRLRRLPEAPDIPMWENKRHALSYLKDWRGTENRMVRMLKI